MKKVFAATLSVVMFTTLVGCLGDTIEMDVPKGLELVQDNGFSYYIDPSWDCESPDDAHQCYFPEGKNGEEYPIVSIYKVPCKPPAETKEMQLEVLAQYLDSSGELALKQDAQATHGFLKVFDKKSSIADDYVENTAAFFISPTQFAALTFYCSEQDAGKYAPYVSYILNTVQIQYKSS